VLFGSVPLRFLSKLERILLLCLLLFVLAIEGLALDNFGVLLHRSGTLPGHDASDVGVTDLGRATNRLRLLFLVRWVRESNVLNDTASLWHESSGSIEVEVEDEFIGGFLIKRVDFKASLNLLFAITSDTSLDGASSDSLGCFSEKLSIRDCVILRLHHVFEALATCRSRHLVRVSFLCLNTLGGSGRILCVCVVIGTELLNGVCSSLDGLGILGADLHDSGAALLHFSTNRINQVVKVRVVVTSVTVGLAKVISVLSGQTLCSCALVEGKVLAELFYAG